MTDEPNEQQATETSAGEPARPVVDPVAVVPAGAVAAPDPASPPVTPDRPAVPAPIESRARRTRPVLGPALTVAGVALWAFVVFGTYTTSWLPGGNTPLNGTLALALAGAVTVRAWVVCVRQSAPAPFAELRASNGRYVSVGVVAFGLWAVAVSGAVFVGQTHSTNLDVVIAGALLMVSALAVVVGQRLSGPRATRPAKARSLVALVAWLVAGLVTLGSCVELIAEH